MNKNQIEFYVNKKYVLLNIMWIIFIISGCVCLLVSNFEMSSRKLNFLTPDQKRYFIIFAAIVLIIVCSIAFLKLFLILISRRPYITITDHFIQFWNGSSVYFKGIDRIDLGGAKSNRFCLIFSNEAILRLSFAQRIDSFFSKTPFLFNNLLMKKEDYDRVIEILRQRTSEKRLI